MAKQKEKNQPVYEDEAAPSRLPAVITAVCLFGAALLMGYVSIAVPEPGTAMGPTKNVLTGLGGSLAVFIAAFTGWLGFLFTRSAMGKKVSAWKSILDALTMLSFFGLVHCFFAEAIMRERMSVDNIGNFVAKSYAYGHGGGAIGALIAYLPYSSLGKWGGVLAILFTDVLFFTITGRTVRFLRWCKKSSDTLQHNTEQKKKVREVEQMFDIEAEKKPRRRTDPMSDELYNTAPQRPVQRRPRPAHMEPEPKAPRRPAVARAEETAEPAKESPRGRKMYRENVKEKPAREKPARIDPTVPAEETILEDIPAEPDFGIVHTEDAPLAQRKAARKKAHTPDVSASVEALRTTKARENQIRMDDEDLTIEPEKCDVLESDDEPPFDMPDKPKKAPAKLKRIPVPEPEEEEYNYPPIDLLSEGERVEVSHKDADMEKAALLEETLRDFGISSKLTGIAHGPAVTRFELQPAPGVKVSRITSLADDIAMRLAAMSVRIEAPIPGKAAVGVEIPNDKVEMVRLRDVLESSEARKSASKIAVGLGKDNSGRYIVADIAKMPHVLIAGQTGSGKSVCINSIITSILFRATPEEVRMILIDPKVVELSIYNDIPHLICPVVTDCKKAASALDWAVAEMSKRYKLFAERGVRDIKGYNKALAPGEKIMPQMVIIIDELADLMMVAPGEVEDSICRLAQLARAAGMHLVIATQRPSVNVITGIIKANIPTRIAFSVASQIDSRTMIDHGGAEKLLGNGDMLFVPSGINKPMRVQGAWVSDEEVHAIVSYIKERSEVEYDADMIEKMDNAARSDAEKEEFNSEYDPLLPKAVEIVVEAGQASVSMLQRRMRVGYARAGRLIDEMEQRGIVSEADGAKPRTVLITREEMEELFEN